MHKSVEKIVSLRWLSLLLLLAGAPLAIAQQPASQTSPATQAPAARDVHARVTQTAVDSSIKDDAAVDRMLAGRNGDTESPPPTRATPAVKRRTKR